jgi:hypothetical protein
MMMIITNRPADGRHVLVTFGWLATLLMGFVVAALLFATAIG